jgi:hypothetical protein
MDNVISVCSIRTIEINTLDIFVVVQIVFEVTRNANNTVDFIDNIQHGDCSLPFVTCSMYDGSFVLSKS